MKPSERRALEAEKKAQKEAEEREKELETRVDNIPSNNSLNDSQRSRKEGFVQSNVRIITFVICLLFLIPICLFGVDTLVKKKRGETVTNKDTLTMENVYFLAEQGNQITWGYFERYNYTDRSISHQGVTTVVREYDVSGTELTVRVVGNNIAKGYPDQVRLIDYWSGEYADIRNGRDAVEDLIKKIQENKIEEK